MIPPPAMASATARQPAGRLIIAVSLRFIDVHEAMMAIRITGPPRAIRCVRPYARTQQGPKSMVNVLCHKKALASILGTAAFAVAFTLSSALRKIHGTIASALGNARVGSGVRVKKV